MDRRLQIRDRATQDLRQHANYILSHGNAQTAYDFLIAAQETFNQLLRLPAMGKAVLLVGDRFGDVRQWRIREFEKHLIFYCFDDEIVDVLRVLHGSRDLDDILPYLDETT